MRKLHGGGGDGRPPTEGSGPKKEKNSFSTLTLDFPSNLPSQKTNQKQNGVIGQMVSMCACAWLCVAAWSAQKELKAVAEPKTTTTEEQQKTQETTTPTTLSTSGKANVTLSRSEGEPPITFSQPDVEQPNFSSILQTRTIALNNLAQQAHDYLAFSSAEEFGRSSVSIVYTLQALLRDVDDYEKEANEEIEFLTISSLTKNMRKKRRELLLEFRERTECLGFFIEQALEIIKPFETPQSLSPLDEICTELQCNFNIEVREVHGEAAQETDDDVFSGCDDDIGGFKISDSDFEGDAEWE